MATSSGPNRPVAAVSRSSRARWARSTGRSEQLTRRLGPLRVAQRHLGDAAHQLGGRSGFPLPGVGKDGPRPFGHAAEVDLGDWQDATPYEPDVELAPGDILLDQDVVELLRHRGHAGAQGLAVADHRAAIQPRARVFRRRLDDGGERKVVFDLALREGPARDGEARLREECVDDRLATAGGDGPETRARNGIPANSSVPTTCSSHSLLPCTPSHRLKTR